jgi:hypothetical protein
MLTVLLAAGAIATQSTTEIVRIPHDIFVEGNEFHSWCSQKEDAPGAMCFGYIVGVADGLEESVTTGGRRTICYPSTVSLGQIRDIVLKYMADNPDKRHYPASYTVQNALSAAFPCKP